MSSEIVGSVYVLNEETHALYPALFFSNAVSSEIVGSVYVLNEETHALYPGLQKRASSRDLRRPHQCELGVVDRKEYIRDLCQLIPLNQKNTAKRKLES